MRRRCGMGGLLALLVALEGTASAQAEEEEGLTPEALAPLHAMSLDELLCLPVWNVSTAFRTFNNVTTHHYANVYDGTGHPAETFSGVLRSRTRR